MLGTVLNRQAEEEQRQREADAATVSSVVDARQSPQPQESVHTDPSSAAAPNTRTSYEEDPSQSVEFSSSSEGEGSVDDDDDDSLSHPLNDTSWTKLKRSLRRIASKLRSAAVALADVDNVWDSPDTNEVRRRDGVTTYGSIDDYADANDNMNGNRTRASVIYNAVTGTTAPTRNRTAVLFWFLLLSFSYASERSTFKLMVDRVGPFRLFSAELIVGCHACLLGVIVLVGEEWRRRDKSQGIFAVGASGLPIPLADIGLMAILDTIYLLLGVISGAHVPPVLTVILVQTTIPLTACFTQCVHPDGHCSRHRSSRGGCNESNAPLSHESPSTSTAFSRSSLHTTKIRIISDPVAVPSVNDVDISSIPHLISAPPPVQGWGGLSRYHIIGTGMIFLAILIGLTPAVLSLDHIVITKKDAIPDRTAYNTIVFCLAAIPSAMSQLYKEHTLTRIRQPIDRNKLNMVLSIFQLLFAVVVSPLAYGLQGMGDGPGWTTLYPSKQIGENFSHGLSCFLGRLDEEIMLSGYPEQAECSWSWLLVLLHVFSIVMVGVSIDKLAAATKVMYRGVSMGIMLAVVFMFIYQIRDQWCEYGVLVSVFHLTSTFVLIIGAEIYHRVSLADATFETVYPEIGDLYEDDDG
ncbi:hypothetical protein ACHAWX_001738 [Stephanocyclus meneghinianus]